MAKVVLIDPYGWQGAVNGGCPSPNIGIAYLAAMLRKHGHEVVILDLNNEILTDSQVLSAVGRYHPNLVGFSVKTATIKNVRRLSQKIKNSFPKTLVILGGPHATLAWRELMGRSWLDAVFVGEGEQVLPDLCRCLATGQPIEDLPGVVTKRNFVNDFRPSCPFVQDLDALPFPEYDLFPENIRERLQTNYPLVTSRGCVYKCTYCSVPQISGRTIRKRSPTNIIQELQSAKIRYQVAAFEIIDDLFNFDINHCKEICQAIIGANIKMNWSCPNGLRADRIDKELAELMVQAGCQRVMVGVESADPIILETVNKGESIEKIEQGIRIFQGAGISVGGFFIIGLPGDSLKAQRKSVTFIKKLGIEALFNMYVPYPGTELWSWVQRHAHFLLDIEEGLHFANSTEKVKPVFETDDFPATERKRAYEMVHVKLGLFDWVIPPKLSGWRRDYFKWVLLWRYDCTKLAAYFITTCYKYVKRAGRRIARLFSGKFKETKG